MVLRWAGTGLGLSAQPNRLNERAGGTMQMPEAGGVVGRHGWLAPQQQPAARCSVVSNAGTHAHVLCVPL